LLAVSGGIKSTEKGAMIALFITGRQQLGREVSEQD